MAVMEMTKNKARQREIISYITNNDVELDELLKLQKELNELMKENTEEKKKVYWSKTFDRVVKNKKWNRVTVSELAELRNAGLSIANIAEHFRVTQSVVFNFTQKNKVEYYKIFDKDTFQKSKEMWNDN
ncbi:DUF2481 family protein [Listeria cossartiae]|uniref:DUF2481 family protein n=1 Tax=Listeria cossartiae TaxID=2838249 RepID=UPI0019E283F2|nr:DUF2481 family protein [Listeria cossartiae]MCD2223208.1 DUF2481 family protein [Listeria cossartiae]MCD2237888.1 DUF2481 family protein [Listeria cossartiae]HAO6541602.1 DUF2481 domain-containing protein [Listeria monocytogenes]